MTVSQLHSLYRAAYAEARRLSDGGAVASELAVDGAGLTALERVIVEFALHDLTNGTPLRDEQAFERAVEQGADLLRGLGLRHGLPAKARSERGGAAPPDHAACRSLVRRVPFPVFQAGQGRREAPSPRIDPHPSSLTRGSAA